MEGWRLDEGIIAKKDISDDELWDIFNHIFSTKSKNKTSYKFIFIKVLIEYSDRSDINNVIGLSELFEQFSRSYWQLVGRYELVQAHKGMISKAESIIIKYINKYSLDIKKDYLDINNKIRRGMETELYKECIKYVVGAVYKDSKGYLYGFSKKTNTLIYNENAKKFLAKNSTKLLKMNKRECIIFLNKVNHPLVCEDMDRKLDSVFVL